MSLRYDVKKAEGRSDFTVAISNGPEFYCNSCNVETHPESLKQKETGEFIPSLSQGMGNLSGIRTDPV